jgi:hypothetical protein
MDINLNYSKFTMTVIQALKKNKKKNKISGVNKIEYLPDR